MPGMPRSRAFDSTYHLLSNPYRYLSHEASLLKSDVFETRLLFEKVICMTGRDAAEIFTDENLFERRNATPEFVRATLLGKHGVQTLDREAHFHRKQMFLSLLGPDQVEELRAVMLIWIKAFKEKWVESENIILYDEAKEILARTVFTWAGIELSESEFQSRMQELCLLFDGAGSVKKHLKVRAARKSLESWMREIILDIRNDQSSIPDSSPIAIIAHFRDLDGNLLSPEAAAVEAINILRPVIAVSTYFVLSAHALFLYPEGRQRIRMGEAGYLDHFVNEVRRFYPFFPSLFAKVKEDFEWKGMLFKKSTRVMLDLHGINHDPRLWNRPQEFFPDRFKNWNGDRYSFVPQGVGDHAFDHRCPGELLTIELLRSFTEFLVMDIKYEVPKQDLFIDMKRLPALPKSFFVMTNISTQIDFRPLIHLENTLWE